MLHDRKNLGKKKFCFYIRPKERKCNRFENDSVCNVANEVICYGSCVLINLNGNPWHIVRCLDDWEL